MGATTNLQTSSQNNQACPLLQNLNAKGLSKKCGVCNNEFTAADQEVYYLPCWQADKCKFAYHQTCLEAFARNTGNEHCPKCQEVPSIAYNLATGKAVPANGDDDTSVQSATLAPRPTCPNEPVCPNDSAYESDDEEEQAIASSHRKNKKFRTKKEDEQNKPVKPTEAESAYTCKVSFDESGYDGAYAPTTAISAYGNYIGCWGGAMLKVDCVDLRGNLVAKLSDLSSSNEKASYMNANLALQYLAKFENTVDDQNKLAQEILDLTAKRSTDYTRVVEALANKARNQGIQPIKADELGEKYSCLKHQN